LLGNQVLKHGPARARDWFAVHCVRDNG
jgi:hypothetical protein